MTNLQQVYEFCSVLKSRYGAGFTQNPMHRGLKIVGEYYTHSGQLLSLVLTVYQNKVETKIYDSAKRLIFNDSATGNINMNMRLIQFIQSSLVSY
jgi:hypothetical protein